MLYNNHIILIRVLYDNQTIIIRVLHDYRTIVVRLPYLHYLYPYISAQMFCPTYNNVVGACIFNEQRSHAPTRTRKRTLPFIVRGARHHASRLLRVLDWIAEAPSLNLLDIP